MARLYANENFPLAVVEELRRLGHDVLTIQETGQAGQSMPDEAILAFAQREGRAVLTLNRKHFFRLHRAGKAHAGVIGCTFDADFVSLARRIDAAIEMQAQLSGVLIRVNRPGQGAMAGDRPL
jgi:hypothetical protein